MRLPTRVDVDRELSRRSLHEYVRLAWPVLEPNRGFTDGRHIALICEELEALDPDSPEGTKELLFNTPPRHMKSLLVGVFWPTWLWGPRGKPHLQLLAGSYALALARRDNVKRRRLIESAWYQERWGHVFKLAGDQSTKERFETSANGHSLIASPDAVTTGEGGDILVFDDPHNVMEAESDLERQRSVDWWNETMSTRGNNPKTVVRVVIGQRTHVNDLTGALLKKGTYRHVCLPAEYEPDHPNRCGMDWRQKRGELLWPEQFGPEELERLKTDLGSYGTAGQLQQRPAPREGGMIKRHWWRIVAAAPATGTFVRFWDRAATEQSGGNDPDYSVGLLMSRDRFGQYFIHDVLRFREGALKVEQTICSTAIADGRDTIIGQFQDPGQAGLEQAQYMTRRLAGYKVHTIPENRKTNKHTGIDPVIAQIEAGNIKLVRGDWNKDFTDECGNYPAGHDDQVAALIGAFRTLLKRGGKWEAGEA